MWLCDGLLKGGTRISRRYLPSLPAQSHQAARHVVLLIEGPVGAMGSVGPSSILAPWMTPRSHLVQQGRESQALQQDNYRAQPAQFCRDLVVVSPGAHGDMSPRTSPPVPLPPLGVRAPPPFFPPCPAKALLVLLPSIPTLGSLLAYAWAPGLENEWLGQR